MSERPEGYIPAAGHDWLLPLYDPLCRLVGESGLKGRLIELAEISPGQRVLDVGCGTGTLALLLAKAEPRAETLGIDGDPKALAIARRKASVAGTPVQFDEGLAYALPYPDASFDRVLSSFVFHHLTGEHKSGALSEILRVLKPGGTLHILDFGRPVSLWDRALAHLFMHSHEARNSLEGDLTARIGQAGFADAAEVERRGSLFGSAWFHRGSKPTSH